MAVKTEDFFDMKIDTISNDAPIEDIIEASKTSDAHLVRIEDPNQKQVETLTREGFFYRPAKIRYFLDTRDIGSLDDYLGSLKAKTRSEFKGILKNVENNFDFACEKQGMRHLEQFVKLYEQMIRGMKRGRNPLRKRHINKGMNGFYDEGRIGFYLLDENKIVAGIIVKDFNDESAPLFDSKGIYFSVSYFAFDRALKGADLENYLMMWALEYAMHQRPQDKTFGCGMDTNLYGHHLSLGMMPFKRKLGFRPEADESEGRELTKFNKFNIFDKGFDKESNERTFLFFEYRGNRLAPVLAATNFDAVQPLNQFVNREESIRLYKINPSGLVPHGEYIRK